MVKTLSSKERVIIQEKKKKISDAFALNYFLLLTNFDISVTVYTGQQ